ncbi:MAG: energy transducer TonB [Prevotella sp.]|nr:energy transducer TonB [Prevotella sp.]
MPSFPGGTQGLANYLGQNIKYPEVCEENGVQGRVICSFIVEKDGSISNIEVEKRVDPALDREAVRVIQNMPKWKPGSDHGKAVRVIYHLPINFRF